MLGALRKRIDKELLHATCTMQSRQRRTQHLLMIREMVQVEVILLERFDTPNRLKGTNEKPMYINWIGCLADFGP